MTERKLATEQGKEYALGKLQERRDNKPDKVQNDRLPAGAPMFYYCVSCGAEMTLPESHWRSPPRLCSECVALKECGWLE